MVKTKKSRKEKNEKDKVIRRADPYCFRRSVEPCEPTLPLISLMLLKFPHLGDTIFQKLDTTALYHCKKVDRRWKEFIQREKFYKDKLLRRIQEVHDELKCNHFNQSTITNTQKTILLISIKVKSLSEALIFASTNPQYDDRLFIELGVQYMKIASSKHVVYINCSECQNKNKKQFVYTTCSPHVLSLQFSCTELVIQ